MLEQMRQYTKLSKSDVRAIGTKQFDGFEKNVLVFQTPFGYRRMAGLYTPTTTGPHPAILYVHWYEPQAHNSNRTQFEAEAQEMARAGALCLTVETLWSDLEFFYKRTQEDDPQNSIEEVVNLRRFMDFLTIQNIDPQRFAYVGHDFGGMYGALAGSLDQRPSHYVLMAATPRFADWYLYRPQLEGAAREAFIRQMSEIDPIAHVDTISPAPILFQFANDDFHVPMERATEFFNAAKEPKEMMVYQAGHELNEDAAKDRKSWLLKQLRLK
jgi:dienelactone hydrolase